VKKVAYFLDIARHAWGGAACFAPHLHARCALNAEKRRETPAQIKPRGGDTRYRGRGAFWVVW